MLGAEIGMLVVETVAKNRRLHLVHGKAIKELCRELRLSRKVVRKAIRSGETAFSYTRSVQPQPKLGPWTKELDSLLAANAARSLRERVTLTRIFEDLRGLGYEGGYDAVRRYAASWRRRESAGTAAAFVPLRLDPGEAYQFDWSTEVVLIAGGTVTIKVGYMRLCHSRPPRSRGFAACRSSGPTRARPKRWCSTPTTRPSPFTAEPARGASTTIYGRLPRQDDRLAVGGIGCVNLSGLLAERPRSGP